MLRCLVVNVERGCSCYPGPAGYTCMPGGGHSLNINPDPRLPEANNVCACDDHDLCNSEAVTGLVQERELVQQSSRWVRKFFKRFESSCVYEPPIAMP